MNWPASHKQLIAEGYLYEDSRPCSSCDGIRLHFYRTPWGRLMPCQIVDVVDGVKMLDQHWNRCREPEQYRAARPKSKAQQERERLDREQCKLF